MKKNNKKIILLVVVLVILAVGWIMVRQNPVTEKNELQTVYLPIDIWPGNFWVIIADKKGYFEEEGLKAVIRDVSSYYNEAVEQFIDGTGERLDTNLLAVFDMAEANALGADLVAVLVSDSSEGAEGLVAKKEYETLGDLKGKRIGIETGTYLEHFLELAMQNAGIEPDEYIEVHIITEDLSRLFEEEGLDAAFSWEPDLSRMKEEHGLHTLFDTSDIRGLSPGIFVFKKSFIEKNPETVQRIMNVWHKATQYILENKDETIDLISKIDFADDPGYFYTPEEIAELLEQDLLLDLEANLKSFGFESGFESLYGNIQYVNLFIQKKLGLETLPEASQMVDDRFIRSLSQ